MKRISYLIVVPIYAELPHIEENLNSIDDWENLFIVDNSADSWCKKFEGRGAQIIYKPENIGVARAWNLGLKEGKDYTFFVSSSVNFKEGFIDVKRHLAWHLLNNKEAVKYGLFTQLGWHCNAITQETVKKVGYFDENFYPAYFEDTDYCRRLYLAGIHPNIKGESLNNKSVATVVINAEPIEIATTIKRAGLVVDFAQLGKYYREKWGGDSLYETYNTPFNQGDLSYFPNNTIKALRKKYGV